jgi:exodeoxyribonuclease VII large subunit
MTILSEPIAGANAPELTVSEVSGAIKRALETQFDHVRVRGEVGRVSRPSSGHLYLDLKDDRAVLASVVWKAQVPRLGLMPEQGDEVVAEGRLTTFPGQSKYQLVIERLSYAGAGALLAKLERLKTALAAEGLFDAARKRPIPYLPRVIGVVTSPTGAVIRDILHRLSDRFPMRVLVWPVAVQGASCAAEVAAAVRGFGALPEDGPVPRPDVVIVARGGGSLEDLWGFNEEAVVRAVAASPIPVISAVGHETDVTLIDFAADRRAPTPTAAAEMAAPVRAELAARLASLEARRRGALDRLLAEGRRTLRDLGRLLPGPDALLGAARQRLDGAGARLPRALASFAAGRRAAFASGAGGRFGPTLLSARLALGRARLEDRLGRLGPALRRRAAEARREAERMAARLAARPAALAQARGREAARLAMLGARLDGAEARLRAARADRLAASGRLLDGLDHRAVLARGFAILRDAAGAVTTRAADLRPGAAVEIELQDGRVPAVVGGGGGAASPTRRDRGPAGGQGSLF